VVVGDGVALAVDLAHPPLDIDGSLAAVGSELPIERLVQRALHGFGVGAHGVAQRERAVVEPFESVEGVHGGEVEPIDRLGRSPPGSAGGALE
jgi:hypothetical protein